VVRPIALIINLTGNTRSRHARTLIDFSVYDENDPNSLRYLANCIDSTMSDIGFMSVTNLGLEWPGGSSVCNRSPVLPCRYWTEEKKCLSVTQENFGYQGICEENLDPTSLLTSRNPSRCAMC